MFNNIFFSQDIYHLCMLRMDIQSEKGCAIPFT